MDARQPDTRGVVAVATSGGRDSTALLHAVVRQAVGLRLSVVALHVHHGLQPNADAWWRHVREQVTRWARAGLPVRAMHERLVGRPDPGDSVEAWARRERYAALGRMAARAGAGLVLMAHHQRDQAETLLLQALRGAGPAGLAAMPARVQRDGLVWARPWLGQSDQALEAYVHRWHLSHIEDDSNHDVRFDRNRLRHRVWPALVEAFPQAGRTLAMAARHAAAAADLIDEVAAGDLAGIEDCDGRLVVPAWMGLSKLRQHFALKHWLACQLAGGVPDSLVRRLADEVPGLRTGRWPDGQGGELRLYRARLWHCPGARLDGQTRIERTGLRPLTDAADLSRPGDYPVPGFPAVLRVQAVEHGGLAAHWLCGARWLPRRGGEQFQGSPLRIPRSLKKQFQAAGVAAWAREGPLLWSSDPDRPSLLFVPGLGLDARVAGVPGAPRVRLDWLLDDSPSLADGFETA